MKEFQKFISKGNVIEIAVGMIMATYFGAIVKSFVNDILMPIIGELIGGIDFSDLKVVLTAATEDVPEVAISYGMFINTIITFLIVAFAIFMMVKGYNNMKERFEKKEAATPPPPSPPSKEEILLTEIRDLLKK